MRDSTWQLNAPCEAAPELFFDDENKKWERKAVAAGYCGLCPLSDECADELVYTNSEFGIWAGCEAGDLHKALGGIAKATDPYETWGAVADEVAWMLVEDDVLV